MTDMRYPSTSRMIADLNRVFRFVSIDLSDPSWSELDEHARETYHTTVQIRLSDVGSTDGDPYYLFDDVTTRQAVKRVWREHCAGQA